MIEIIKSPAYLALQDLGFVGFRKMGLPRCGAMDPHALMLGNSLVGNSIGEVGFEWALSGGTVKFQSDIAIAFTGATVHGRLGQQPITMNTRIEVKSGTTLDVDRFSAGRFAYLCVSGTPATPLTFNSRSTYLAAGIGGFEGRRLRSGDTIHLAARPDPVVVPQLGKPDRKVSTFRVVAGPQGNALGGRLLEFVLQSDFSISRHSDRTGYRLEGPPIDLTGLNQILSEPACEGAIQITDAGTPIVLMADGPTIGGYNKVAVVIREDLGALAQKSPGERVRFAPK